MEMDWMDPKGPEREITIEPLKEPVPSKEPTPAPKPIPIPEPEREPEKVPA
jgi:hypothetical protein